MVELLEVINWACTAVPMVRDYIQSERIRTRNYGSFEELQAEPTYGWFSRRAKAERIRHYEINGDRLDPDNF